MPYVHIVCPIEAQMVRKIGKRKMSEIEGTSISMAIEDRLQPHQAQQFPDTECRIEKDIATLTWVDIYIEIKEQTYVDLYLLGETMKECDKKTWVNIRRSRINQVTTRPGISPCAEFIHLMVKKSDLENH